MNEDKDDVMLSVDSTKRGENVTEKQKIEEIFGERDEGEEDMMVDVVGSDVVVVDGDDHGGGDGGSRVKVDVNVNGVVEETGTRDEVMEDVGDVLSVEKGEVVKENVVTAVASGSDCDGEKEGNGTAVEDSRTDLEPVVEKSEGEVAVSDKKEVTESVQEVGKEAEVLSSSEVAEPITTEDNHGSSEGRVEDVEEGLVGKDKVEDGVDNPSLLTEVVNAGSVEENVDVSATNEEHQAGVDQTKNESLQSTIEVTKNDAQIGDSKMDVESESVEPEVAIREGESERGLNDETVEQTIETVKEVTDVDHVMNVKTGKDEVLDSVEIPESVTKVDEVVVDHVMNEKRGKDEVLDSVKIPETVTKVDEVVVEECLAAKDETQDGVSEGPILSSDVVNAGTDEGKVHEHAENLDQKAEADEIIKEESSQSTIEVKTDSKIDDPPKIVEEIAVINKEKEPETGLTKETVEQPTVSVQEVADADHVSGEKPEKEDKVLDSSKIPESSTIGNHGSEEVDVVVVEEVLEEKDEAQEVVNAETCEVLTTEVDTTGKDESSHAKIEVLTTERSETVVSEPDEVAASGKVDEVMTTAEKEPNSDVQVSTAGEILVENQRLEVGDVADSSKPNVVECTEQESPVNKTETPIMSDTSNLQEDQGLNAIPSNDQSVLNSGSETTELHIGVSDSTVEVPTTGGTHTSAEDFDRDNHATTHAGYASEHDVIPADTQFSYEEAHMEREDDAGVDIDEVLGWKDEIAPMQVDPTNLSSIDEEVNVDVEELEHTLEAKQWNETSVSLHQSSYFHSPENEGEFSVSDLVWGKVRSHPWWPGQIFDPSDASEKAMKYYKKDCFLVAYFGDRTFAWNESTVLKPFRSNFSQIANHTNLEAFNNAVHCALEEVSRRVELGLTCSCIPHDIYENIKCQIVENAGIKQESSKRQGIDKSASVNSFEPDKLVDYVRLLAKFPYGEGDKMELTMAKAQLSSYGRFKGHRQLAEFQICGDLLEDDQVVIDATYFEDGSRKRKALDSVSDGSEKRPNLHTEPVPTDIKPSFKVGACIQKVASQLTGVDQVAVNAVVSDQSEMLSQLHLAAQDPMKGYNFLNTIIPFFNNYRAAVLNKARQIAIDARKRKTLNENDPEEYEFDDVNDSYWTDRIIQNYPDEQMLQENQNGGGAHHQLVAYEQDKRQHHHHQHQHQQHQQPVKQTRRSNKKRFFSSNHEIEAKEQTELIERRRLNLATEVLMKFPEGVYFPSEIHLNKMFKRFGPLLESETEVDRNSGRARVVFKKCSDAEVAHSSAGKFNIFGSIVVNYELNYTPLISYKPLPLQFGQDQQDAC